MTLSQRLCALTGHDYLRRYAPDRLSLVCVTCGLETVGWEVEGKYGARGQTEPVPTWGSTASSDRS
jgi:hypothetical protein